MMNRRQILAGGAAALAPVRAFAAEWPVRPISLVVPYTPGGSTDITARIVGERLSTALGQRLIVDNKPGAGGNLGMEITARAAPDGYTLGLNTTAHAINMTLFRTINYDAVASFEPVALLTENPLVLVVPPASPARSVAEFIALARAKPGTLNFATSGIGQSTHLAAELFAAMAGIKLTHVPYRGSAPAIADVVAGHVDLMFDTTQSVLSQVNDGRVRGLGITSAERLPIARDIPTIAEAALPATSRSPGTGSSPPRARRPRSSPASTPRPSRRWPRRRSPTSSRRSAPRRARSARRPSRPSSATRSRNGAPWCGSRAPRWSRARE